jgi:microcystin-dependent protein
MGTPFLGEIKMISWNFAPKNWAFCNGQLLPINQNQALFSLLGTQFGGNGQTTFGLPDLRGRVPIHADGGAPGLVTGEAAHTLIVGEMPAHFHSVAVDAATAATSNTNVPASNTVLGQSIGAPSQGANFPVQMYSNGAPATGLAPATIGNFGGSQPHDNMQPYLVINFVIALNGVFPSRN